MADKVTVEVVERVAELANLELTQEESVAMVRDLNSILGYVAQLGELDTSRVEPLAQVTELIHAEEGDCGTMHWRPRLIARQCSARRRRQMGRFSRCRR
jgi:aspartyl/glutamyl-tRNA(Asn/Gln) amidotransferase C subunit